jgi:hypothetical protein
MVLYGLARDAVGAMADLSPYPPLKFLHLESSLNPVKLAQMDRLSTEDLCTSLLPGQSGCLKTRPEGTILDGHHRIHILCKRGVDVDALPREIVFKDQE